MSSHNEFLDDFKQETLLTKSKEKPVKVGSIRKNNFSKPISVQEIGELKRLELSGMKNEGPSMKPPTFNERPPEEQKSFNTSGKK